MTDRPLVSIGMPVRNGEERIPAALRSVLEQSYSAIEVIISDNDSTDDTEGECRRIAGQDPRVSYHRQPTNVGLFENFLAVMRMAKGEFFCWLGDDDVMHPDFVERSAAVLSADPELVVATTEVSWEGPEGDVVVRPYGATVMQSRDRLVRFEETMRLLNRPPEIDPLASLMRRDVVAQIERRNMMREDQHFAAQLALAGPWGHVPEVLLSRSWKHETRPDLARHLDLPAWQGRFTTSFQTAQLWRLVGRADLTRSERWSARRAVVGHHIGWHRRRIADRLARS